MRKLCGDAASWLQDAEEPRAIRQGLARFHHGLVSIHPFRNGNERHARLATDLLARALDEPIPVWGAHVPESERVDVYLDAPVVATAAIHGGRRLVAVDPDVERFADHADVRVRGLPDDDRSRQRLPGGRPCGQDHDRSP